MRVLFVTAECVPWSKTGGLGDVAGALPAAVRQHGMDMRVLTPWYDETTPHGTRIRPGFDEVTIGPHVYPVEVWEDVYQGVAHWFLRSPALFERPALYEHRGTPFPDNPIRFALLSRVGALLAEQLDVDVLHANDWHTALACAWFPGVSVFTIHNLMYQGVFPLAWGGLIGLDPVLTSPRAGEFYGSLNLMKLALTQATAVTTVSETYAQEILTPEFGCGLDGVLAHDVARLVGIRNGIGAEWDPARDPHLPANYSRYQLDGKASCRAELLRRVSIDEPEDPTPIIGVIGRVVRQKGYDLIIEALHRVLPENDAIVVILGSGDAELETRLQALAASYPNRVRALMMYDETMAHLIEAGSDLFLMPSRFEPCGLNQMYSMRYGTLPVVTPVGGLKDTVVDIDDSGGTGFVTRGISSDALAEAVVRALRTYEDSDTWSRAVQTAMNRDFSWAGSAKLYAELYTELVERGS